MKEYPNLSQAIGSVIEAVRKERKMTKSSLAEFAWLERRYLRDLEQGIKKPTVNVIYCICEALRIEPLEFFERVGTEMKKLGSDG